MTSLPKSTKLALIFVALGIAVGVGVTLVFVLSSDEGEGIVQRLVSDNRDETDQSYVELKGVVRPAIYHKSVLTSGEQGIFTADVTGGTPPYQFQWEFGDGSSGATLRNVTHSFASTGEYNVRLTTTDASGIKGVISVRQMVAP